MVNELNKQVFSLQNMEANILPSDFDLILGRPTIKEFNLTHWFPSQFCASDYLSEELQPGSGNDSMPPIATIRPPTATGDSLVEDVSVNDEAHPIATPSNHCSHLELSQGRVNQQRPIPRVRLIKWTEWGQIDSTRVWNYEPTKTADIYQ